MSHLIGAIFSLAVGVIAFSLTALGFMAYRRTGDRRLLLVSGAFGAFAVKGILIFLDFQLNHFIGHDTMEIVSTALDLTVVLLLVAPFLSK